MTPPATSTICRICKENCGLLVKETGEGIQVSGNPEHPISQGFICFRGKNYGHVRLAPDRLHTPLLRKNGRFVPISFDQAMDVLAENLGRSRDRFGPESVCLYKGESLKHQEVAAYMKHLAHGLGSPNYISVGSLCHRSMAMGHGMTYGGIPAPDFQRMKAALIWGANPAVSSQRTYAALKSALASGVKLVVIDPSRTKTARAADIHLAVRPGGDGFLALAFLKMAVERTGLLPAGKAEGFDALTSMLAGLSLDRAIAKAGLEREAVEAAWRLLSENRPVWVQTGLGLELKPTGVQTIRAAACLQSLLDDVRPVSIAAGLAPLPGSERYPERPKSVGTRQTPLFTSGDIEGQGMFWDKAILNDDPYPLRSMLIMGANPMLTFPNEAAQRNALSGLDFLAVFDLFMTPTAELADLVIPAADAFDMLELHDYGAAGKPYLGLVRPVFDRPGKGVPSWKVLFELAARLGMADLFPWKDNREAIGGRLEGSGVSLNDLEESSSSTAQYLATAAAPGAVRFVSSKLDAAGLAAMPTPESLTLPSEPDADYPFFLSSGDRVSPYQHSQFHNVREYHAAMPAPFLDMHPGAAQPLGVEDGDRVRLSTRQGAIELPVRLCADLRADSLRLAHGWRNANANALTGLTDFDPISGFPWLMSLAARVERV